MLCPTVCPAECIHIVAGEREDKEKYPVKFEIDSASLLLLRNV